MKTILAAYSGFIKGKMVIWGLQKCPKGVKERNESERKQAWSFVLMHAKQNGSLILTMITEMKLIGYRYAQSSW